MRFFLRLAWLMLVAMGLPLSAWVLFHAQNWVGTALALFGFTTLGFLTTLAFAAPFPFRTVFRVIQGTLLLIAVALLVVIISQAPTGCVSPSSPISNQFTKEARFPRFRIANIVPESEQINLGLSVMTFLDPYLTAEQVKRVGPPTLRVYHELENDPDFHDLGSVMGWAYDDVFGMRFDVGHYFLYVPRNAGKRPLPAIVFLHGSGGNFKAYMWVWSRLAEKQGFIIIAPSFGFGNWRLPESLNVVTKAIEHAAAITSIDRNHLYLAGLSNGGLGTCQIGLSKPDLFRGLIFISPVFDRLIDQPPLIEAWKNRPMLVIAGAVDERIPIDYVEAHVAALKKAGVNVEERIYPKQDHFLFFSERERAVVDIASWLERVERKTKP